MTIKPILTFRIRFGCIIQCLKRLLGWHFCKQRRTLVAKYFSLSIKRTQASNIPAWVMINRHIAQLASLKLILTASFMALLIPLF